MHAVEILTTKVLDSKEHGMIDILIYPIVFMSRHVIELQIKDITLYLNVINTGKGDYSKFHDLKNTEFFLKKQTY